MKIVIVGAGIAGLVANHQLTRLGHDVEIYEATERAGGRGKLMNRPNTEDWADVGSQYFMSGYDVILRVIDELGLSAKLKVIEGRSRIFTAPGRSFALNPKTPWMGGGSVLDNLRLMVYTARLGLKRAPTFAPAPRDCALDDLAVLDSTNDDFIRNYFLRMATRTGLLTDLERANVSSLFLHRSLKTFVGKTLSLEGGTATLHEALARHATIYYSRPVESLVESAGRVTGIKLESGEVVHADHVFVAAHPPKAAGVVPESWHVEREYLAGIEMSTALIVSLFLTEPMKENMLSYYMPLDGRTDVSFCTDANQKGTGNTPSGKSTLQAWIVSPRSLELIDKTDEEIHEVARLSVAEYLPEVAGQIEGFAVTRHQHALPLHRVGHNRRTLDFLESADRRQGISFVGDYLFGISMETAARTVERAIARIAA